MFLKIRQKSVFIFSVLLDLCTHESHWAARVFFFFFPGERGIYMHISNMLPPFLTTECRVLCDRAALKVKDCREDFTRGGSWTLQTCLNSPVMLFLTIRSFPTDIPTWVEGSSTVFLSFLFTSPPLMCLVSHFWHSCLSRSLELTSRSSLGHKPSMSCIRTTLFFLCVCVMAWVSVYHHCR